MSDGAAAVVLARRSVAKRLGMPILGVFRSFAVVGVPPDVMGIGPAYAIPKALDKAGEWKTSTLWTEQGDSCVLLLTSLCLAPLL